MSSVLTKEEIIFIDTYLINTDIQFIDVRMEMVDHIASTIEQKIKTKNTSFYLAFKAYMIENKKELEKNYKQQKKKNQLNGFKLLWPVLKKPGMVFLFIISLVLLHNFESFTGNEFPYIAVMWSYFIFIATVYFIFSIPFKKNRFSNLEALSWVIFVWHYVLMLIFNYNNLQPTFYAQLPWLINLFTAFFISFCTAWLFTFFKQRKHYKQKFRIE